MNADQQLRHLAKRRADEQRGAQRSIAHAGQQLVSFLHQVQQIGLAEADVYRAVNRAGEVQSVVLVLNNGVTTAHMQQLEAIVREHRARVAQCGAVDQDTTQVQLMARATPEARPPADEAPGAAIDGPS